MIIDSSTSSPEAAPPDSGDVRPCQNCGKYISTLATLCKHCWSENRPLKEVVAERRRQSVVRRVSTVMLVFSALILVLSLAYRFHLSNTVLTERALALQHASKPTAAPAHPVRSLISRHGPVDPSQQALVEDIDDTSVTSMSSQLQTCYITIALSCFSLLCSGFAFWRS